MTRIPSAFDHPLAQAIADSIRATVNRELAPEEAAWVSRIEARREALLRSERRITFRDHGAGRPHETRTDEQMREGVEISTTVAEACAASMKPARCLLLFELARRTGATQCVELGTNLGVSAAYLAAALALNGRGHLVTLEGAEEKARLAELHFVGLELSDYVTTVAGRFQDQLIRTLEALGTVDLVLLDGHHTEAATLHYFEALAPYTSDRTLLVLDDIRWNEAMWRAWQSVSTNARCQLAVDLGAIGLCALGTRKTANPLRTPSQYSGFE